MLVLKSVQNSLWCGKLVSASIVITQNNAFMPRQPPLFEIMNQVLLMQFTEAVDLLKAFVQKMPFSQEKVHRIEMLNNSIVRSNVELSQPRFVVKQRFHEQLTRF